jgi:carnitine O-acetyltransferase
MQAARLVTGVARARLKPNTRMMATASRRSENATYANQSKLPRLPVPDLDKSLEAYVKSLVPLLEQKVGPSNQK